MKRFFFFGIENSFTTDVMLALFRVFSGLAMAFGHGLRKIPPSEGFIEHTGELGFPFPDFFAYSAGLAEFAGGILLAFGLLTRTAAFFMMFTMFVAGFINHADDPFGSAEKAYLYFAISLMYLVIGAGRFSMDTIMRRKLNI